MAENRETRTKEHARSYRSTSPERTAYKEGEGRDAGMLTRRGSGTTLSGYGSSYSPFSMMRRLVEDMDRMFTDFGAGSTGSTGHWSDTGSLSESLWAPEIETFRRDDKLVVRADLPGLNKDNVNVEIENDMLTISGERQDEHTEERDDYYRSERSYGSFYRAIPLPDNVDEDKIDAKFKDGVLEVTMPAPREEKSERKRIAVK